MKGWATLLAWSSDIWHCAHRGLALSIEYLGLCFPSFHSPFTPSLYYGPSRKTTLRLWDLVFALTHFIRTGSIYWLKYGIQTRLHFLRNIEDRILLFSFISSSLVHDQRQMMHRVETVHDPLRLLVCYIHTRAYPYPCMMASVLTLGRKQPISLGDAWH